MPEQTWKVSTKPVVALEYARGSDYVYGLTEDGVSVCVIMLGESVCVIMLGECLCHHVRREYLLHYLSSP